MAAKASERQQPKFLDRLSIIKESISIIWSFSLLIGVILLIAIPEWLGGIVDDRLSRAGVKKLKVAGVEFEQGLEDTTDKLEEAFQRIALIEDERDRFGQSLSEYQARVEDRALQERLGELRSKLETSSRAIDSFQVSLESTINNSRALLNQPSQKAPSGLQEAYCYQEDRLKDGPDRYSVHCHSKKDVCEEARGPSNVRKQTSCELTDLSKAEWKPLSPGWLGSMYQFSRNPFPEPFPQLSQ